MIYIFDMFRIVKTEIFEAWFEKLDGSVRPRVQARIDNVENGHFGDHKVYGSLGELRFKSGLRIYYMRRGKEIVILLSGGDKDSQESDFREARAMIKAIKEDGNGKD